MKYAYWKHNCLLVGKMMSGKTYQTKNLLKSAPKDRIIVLDAHANEGTYSKLCIQENIIAAEKPYNSEWVDKTIKKAYQNYHAVVVFDDIDLFIKYPNDCESLKDFFIDGRHQELAAIVQSKRPTYLDKRIIQNCRYVFIFKGTLQKDFERIKYDCNITDNSIDELYAKLNDSDDKEHLFILIDAGTGKYSLLHNLTR
jgi:hypothetical protein